MIELQTLIGRYGQAYLEHDPQKWIPLWRQDHAQAHDLVRSAAGVNTNDFFRIFSGTFAERERLERLGPDLSWVSRLNFTRLPPPPPDLLQDGSLFLDFDGTIVEIAPRPGDVRVDERLDRLLRKLSARLGKRVAVVSGRPADEISDLLPVGYIAIAGSHGAELLWPDGRVIKSAGAPIAGAIRARLQTLAREHPGVLVEEKPLGIAIHYRLAPLAEGECLRLAQRLASESGFVIQTGKQVVELKTTPANKSDAVAAFMLEPPMKGTRPVFIGDDDTDEAGFAMASQLGGSGILVGAPRATAASYQLADVGSALRWLEAACGALP